MYDYAINVAEIIAANIGKPFGPYHTHYCLIQLGRMRESEAIERFHDIAVKFPAPLYKLTLTKREERFIEMAV